jgi:hypothetical protein
MTESARVRLKSPSPISEEILAALQGACGRKKESTYEEEHTKFSLAASY